MNRFISLLIFLFSMSVSVSAQVEKPFFQIFDISNDIKTIKVETCDSFKVRQWRGTQMMLDMSIRLDGGTMDLLGIIIFDNRYAYDPIKQGDNLIVRAKMLRRDITKLKYLGNMCVEKVTMTIYLPEGFTLTGHNEFSRKPDVFIASDRK